jgi:preprotein translocase subunit SecE
MTQETKKVNIAVSWVQKAATFIKEARVEARKVVWPDRRYTTVATFIVLMIVLLSAFFVWFVDLGFASLFLYLIKVF